jgi:NifU-like protein involved in Fe-S cluster formation
MPELSPQVRERLAALPHAGVLPGGAVGEVDDAGHGALIRIWVRRDGARIAEARFQAFGCPSSIAAASLAAELAQGMPCEEARNLPAERLIGALSLPEEKAYAGSNAATALARAVVASE